MVVSDALVNAVLKGGKKITEMISSVTKTFLTPALEAIKRDIKKIDTNIAGITREEKRLLTQALEALQLARHNMLKTRTFLENLATEVKKQVKVVLGILHLLFDKVIQGENDTLTEVAHTAIKEFVKLMERALEHLQQASDVYETSITQLFSCHAHLTAFNDSCKRLSKGQPGYDDWVKEYRQVAYPLSCLGGPISIGITAAVLETEIAKWYAKMEGLFRIAKLASESSGKILNKVNGQVAFVQEEIRLIEKLKARVQDSLENQDKMKTIVKIMGNKPSAGKIKMATTFANQVKESLNDLDGACNNYLAHQY